MSTDPRARDDNLMERFEMEGLNRFSARQGVIAIAITGLLLVLSSGASIRTEGEEMDPGIGRDIVLGVGKPAGWLADKLPFAGAAHSLTAAVRESDAPDGAGFAAQTSVPEDKLPAIPPAPLDPPAAGDRPAEKRPLETLLVTGDSLSTPLDRELAGRLTPEGITVVPAPHLGTGISTGKFIDWGAVGPAQVDEHHPDAVVVFIGAGEGDPMPGPEGLEVSCCGPDWTAVYAYRVRQLMNTYRQAGASQVFWLNVMTLREPDKQRVAEAVNQAIVAAARPWPDEVHPIDLGKVFTPGDRYRDAMQIDGSEQIVRESDGIHLNKVGSGLAAEVVIDNLDDYFTIDP